MEFTNTEHRFHPAVDSWFARTFPRGATEVQRQAWPAIQRGEHTLLAAPTGSGKTLAAFLAAIDGLVREGLNSGLDAGTRILYVSPLKALSNDVEKNLRRPLEGIRHELMALGLPDVDIKAAVRTGDTPQTERSRMRRTPPHILVTTPESVFILLTSESGRRMLETVRTVIVDEIHAAAGSKRGAHLCLSLERLHALTGGKLTRIGMSATQKPIERMADFLIGDREVPRTIVDTGHGKRRDIELVLPDSPLAPLLSNDVWEEIYDRIADLVAAHRTTLVFVNTRRLAERVAHKLAERLGDDVVTSHHGSLATEHRLDAEQRLKSGALRALVATASLELGIDIGDVDLVCQLGSPRAIAAFIQRVGRSGHQVGGCPKGRLFPLSRDDLAECAALTKAAHDGHLDRIEIPLHPLDVLAQQMVAEVAGQEWEQDELFAVCQRAWPYRKLTREQFDSIVHMLADGFSTRRGRRGAYLHHDAVNGRLRPRRGARLTAMMNAGAIPDQFDVDVILLPDGFRIGTLNEDFAIESTQGDIFQLGNTSYRVLRVTNGKLFVEDARGQPPNIPFWLGEAPGRTDELSLALSDLRKGTEAALASGVSEALDWLKTQYALNHAAASQLADYLASGWAALGTLPTLDTIVMERFFDEAGDMHLVVHSPFGSRINRAWGLSLRKRFCRKFNFELQAAATEDNLILSLGATHSFPLDDVKAYLASATVRDVLVQALLDAPMFETHWRWNATIALAIKRMRNGKKTPPPFQRADAEDLVALVFPDQLACAENLAGHREVPDHPLVEQTISDCLHDLMDIRGLEKLLDRIASGNVQVVTRDLTGPSPLATEILTANPYAFLDDAPAEERRTRAVQARGRHDPESARELGRLDQSAIEKVREQAWPEPRDADELHDALVVLGFVNSSEAAANDAGPLATSWQHLFAELQHQRRACALTTPGGATLWVAAERLREFLSLWPEAPLSPRIDPVVRGTEPAGRDDALRELLRSRLEGLGPVTAQSLGASLAGGNDGISDTEVDTALLALEGQGFVIRGQFEGASEEWCERRLLARIHRYTVKRLRSEIEPVTPAIFMRFLFDWQGLGDERGEGISSLAGALSQLEGVTACAHAWEQHVLPARLDRYETHQLDSLCGGGQFMWHRPARAANGDDRLAGPVSTTPVALIERANQHFWRQFSAAVDPASAAVSGEARRLLTALSDRGACFFNDLLQQTGLPRAAVEQALGELVSWGLVTSDSFAGLRALVAPAAKRKPIQGPARYRRGAATAPTLDNAGRWSLTEFGGTANEGSHEGSREGSGEGSAEREAAVQHVAVKLLERYGVVFKRMLEREVNLPTWRELLLCYWRMEARGEVRGGRFVDGFAGEQFALPDAVGALRAVRRAPKSGQLVSISAADPLNLAGIVLPGERVPAIAAHRLEFRDGVVVAAQTAAQCVA
ncbi:MAG: DEAD/DEAH box helicase [Pseudomonadota bacterium]